LKGKYFSFLFFLFILTTFSYAINECKGTITIDDVPCGVYLPKGSNNCSLITVQFFNESNPLYSLTMNDLNSFTCNSTFNQSFLGTYTFNYTTGDSGSIVVEDSKVVDFFNLTVYLVFITIAFVFIILMHIFKETTGTSIVYGFFSTAISAILGAMIISDNFQVIRGVLFFIDVDYYLAAISFIMALYTALISINIRKATKPKEIDHTY